MTRDWIELLAWSLLILGTFAQLSAVRLVGKPRPSYTQEFIATRIVVFALTIVPLCGRVIGWW